MNLLLTGATGFIGRHLVPKLLNSGHKVTIICRNKAKLMMFDWASSVRVIDADLHQLELKWLEKIGEQDALVHLAWQGLPNYQAEFHVTDNLPADFAFIEALIAQGIRQVMVTGTCFEYGNQSGCLNEEAVTLPENRYAFAKNELRKQLQSLQQRYSFRLQWARLFYMYGEGQNSNSLLSQLNRAIDNHEPVFNMSGGEQLRDYLPVETVAEYLHKLVESKNTDGIINICSGQPMSVYRLVTDFIQQYDTNIKLNLGYYPYSEGEPMAFWGDQKKLQTWIAIP